MICENCFGDYFLAEHIRREGLVINNCQYCNSVNIKAIEPIHISDIVAPILDAYNESTDDNASSLAFYLKRDWSHLKNVSDETATKILDAIFPELNIPKKRYTSKQSQSERLKLWDDFQNELKHTNRFFPKIKIIEERELQGLLEFLILKSSLTNFYRARICNSNNIFLPAEMGRPPINKAKGGRANPVGISYLYTASDVDTAIAEVRPSVGDKVSVAEFSSVKELILLDLRNPRETISPFEIGDEDQIIQILNEMSFLIKLGEQLSKPILPKEVELEYLASQYLSEMIKHFGYDGVVYKSSVGKGFNIAFFDDSKLVMPTIVKQYDIPKIDYAYIKA